MTIEKEIKIPKAKRFTGMILKKTRGIALQTVIIIAALVATAIAVTVILFNVLDDNTPGSSLEALAYDPGCNVNAAATHNHAGTIAGTTNVARNGTGQIIGIQITGINERAIGSYVDYNQNGKEDSSITMNISLTTDTAVAAFTLSPNNVDANYSQTIAAGDVTDNSTLRGLTNNFFRIAYLSRITTALPAAVIVQPAPHDNAIRVRYNPAAACWRFTA